jgi:hypothetical protein
MSFAQGFHEAVKEASFSAAAKKIGRGALITGALAGAGVGGKMAYDAHKTPVAAKPPEMATIIPLKHGERWTIRDGLQKK